MLFNRSGTSCQDVMLRACRGGGRWSPLLPLIVSQMRAPRWPRSQSYADMGG
jgi:hypothetical protein